MTTIYLLRHGEIESDGVRRFIGQTDVSLTPLGVEQAHRWRESFAQKNFEGIYASDLSRCAETARIIAKDKGGEVQYRPELREIDLGRLDGHAMDEVRQGFQNEWEARGRDICNYIPEGGESFSDVEGRVIPVLQEIICRHGGNVLIVTHAGVNRVVLCHALGMPLENLIRIEQSYGCLNLLEWKADSFRVMGINLYPRHGKDS
jgi:probable phosphoglycerate mutase